MSKPIALNENDVFLTVSHRLTTPFPRTNYKNQNRNFIAINTWLKENAMLEAKETGNDFMGTITKGLDPKNWSTADSAQCNLFLFNDADGEIGHLKA
ncbi:hypothetical protein LMH73_004815 [Vibrio splendidus]|nr:hypothetical protein [Vibrio splendidus]MCC4882551.1 hypothetical protein [Vibrio splendidus]